MRRGWEGMISAGRYGLLVVAIITFCLPACSGKEEAPAVPAQPAPAARVEKPAAPPVPPSEGGEPGGQDAPAPGEELAAVGPPRLVSLKLTPSVIYPGTKVKVEAAVSSADTREISYLYRWKRGDDFIPEQEGPELSTEGFSRGDVVTAFVTPLAGEEKGEERWSPSLVISNRPPEITSAPSIATVDGVVVYDVEATDPDGDVLTYSLEQSPPGMTIDRSSGKISWPFPADFRGTVQIRVVVSDGDAQSFQSFSFNVGPLG